MKRNSKSPVLFPAAAAGLLMLAATQLGIAGMCQLADLGVYNGEAAGLNSSGRTVGWTYNRYWSDYFAVFWTNSSSPLVDLNSLVPGNSGWVWEEATAINDSGEIVGYGKNAQGNQDAFALPPSPVLHIPMSGPSAPWSGGCPVPAVIRCRPTPTSPPALGSATAARSTTMVAPTALFSLRPWAMCSSGCISHNYR